MDILPIGNLGTVFPSGMCFNIQLLHPSNFSSDSNRLKIPKKQHDDEDQKVSLHEWVVRSYTAFFCYDVTAKSKLHEKALLCLRTVHVSLEAFLFATKCDKKLLPEFDSWPGRHK